MRIAARRYERFAVQHLTAALVFALIAVALGEFFGFAVGFGIAMSSDDGDTHSLGAASTSTPTFWFLNGIRIAMAVALTIAALTRPVPAASKWCARATGAALGSVVALFSLFIYLLTVDAF